MVKSRQELIKKYKEFFKTKGHSEIPSSSLVPENDPTVLFTTAGMHPLVPFLLGEKHPLGRRITNVQKCIRTQDIDEVGDSTHHTFFEMLGNWSLGDYFKKESIEFSFEFLTKILKIPIDKIAVTCFKGDKNSPKDTEAAETWEKLGIPKNRISFLGKKDNWWGPAGETGPCGPDTEIFYWKSSKKVPEKFDPEDENWVEIWNNVFMQYNKDKNRNYKELKQKNVDTGMGVERTLSILNNLEDDYKSSCFLPLIKKIEKLSGKKYEDSENKSKMRIIADHVKAATFMLADNVIPSNIERGYVLRRLIRRAIRFGKMLEIESPFISEIAKQVHSIYPDYEELEKNKKTIISELNKEEEKFSKTLESGLRKFNSLSKDKIISGKEAFLLFQSFGFPIEMTEELANEKGIKVDLEQYNKEFKKHQELSRTASKGKFKSGLADDSESTKKLHTATHLLNEALRRVLGEDIQQKGSNINPERLRFDFNFDRKLNQEEKEAIENLVNEKIKAGLEVKKEELPLKKARKQGAQGVFGAKYPDKVSVYTLIDPKEKQGWFSKEICTGPHVSNTKELGKFKIKKEESSSAGVRRIKAILE